MCVVASLPQARVLLALSNAQAAQRPGELESAKAAALLAALADARAVLATNANSGGNAGVGAVERAVAGAQRALDAITVSWLAARVWMGLKLGRFFTLIPPCVYPPRGLTGWLVLYFTRACGAVRCGVVRCGAVGAGGLSSRAGGGE